MIIESTGHNGAVIVIEKVLYFVSFFSKYLKNGKGCFVNQKKLVKSRYFGIQEPLNSEHRKMKF